jgi:hypothetical protein
MIMRGPLLQSVLQSRSLERFQSVSQLLYECVMSVNESSSMNT